jgi:gluconolactonase
VQALIRVFDVSTYGSLMNGRVFASGLASDREPGLPDGMKCDSRGNVWCTAPGGVWVFAPSGELIGKLRVPEMVANLAWGGPDFRTLFLCATHSVYSVKTKVGPRLEPYMRPRLGDTSTGSSHQVPPTPRPSAPTPAPAPPPPSSVSVSKSLSRLDPSRCALIIQDMQNDVVMEGGAFASSGSPVHCKQQNAIANAMRLADACRKRGVMVIHVWFVVEAGAPGVTLNAPLFEGLVESKAMVRGTWGAAPVVGLEAKAGDHVVEKMRMSAWEGSRLETVLKSGAPRYRHRHRRLDEYVDRAHGPDRRRQGLLDGRARGLLLDHERRLATAPRSTTALQNVSAVSKADDVIAALG